MIRPGLGHNDIDKAYTYIHHHNTINLGMAYILALYVMDQMLMYTPKSVYSAM